MNLFLSIVLALCLSKSLVIAGDSSLPPPYDSVELLSFDPHGWYTNAEPIKKLFAQKNPSVVIEVGCWLGTSTSHMASLLGPEGVLYAVDHWLGSVEHQPGQPFWHPALPKLYDQFLSNVIHTNLTNNIIPVRMSSLEASVHLAGKQADLVYIDASHDYESVYADLNAWYPFVEGHGTLCGDDWQHPPIQEAVYKFAQEHGLLIITPEARFWYLAN